MLTYFEENLCIAFILFATLCITYMIDKSVPCTIEKPTSAISLENSYSSYYCHGFWPSPRAVNFVKALVKSGDLQINGRLTHRKAIELLASRANMKPEEFLRIDPITYIKNFMPFHYDIHMLLGKDIAIVLHDIRVHRWLIQSQPLK